MKTLVAILVLSAAALAQTADPTLLAEINSIKAIDNHAHPYKVVAPGEKDDEFDALPCDPISQMDPPLATRPENPEFLKAWKALWGYQYNDASPAHVQAMLAAKDRIKQQQGDRYPSWVLDHLGIQTEFANREALGRGLQPPRFRWVPFDDALLSPLDHTSLADNPDRVIFYQRESALLKRYMNDLGIQSLPATLAEYTSQIVTPALERQKQAGAVAIKFEAAYLRSLDFEPASQQDAATVYAQYARGGVPNKREYLMMEDYLLRYIASEAGRLHMAVHFHTGGGCGSYFDLPGSDPALLSSVIDDPALRKTTFVFLHGGAQTFSNKVSYLMSKPNAYTDFSEQTWLLPASALSKVLREWLEWYPDKVLYGTDLSPGPPGYDWEEVGWIENHTAREALALALTGMMRDGEITREQANKFAHMVMHDTAAKLYQIQ